MTTPFDATAPVASSAVARRRRAVADVLRRRSSMVASIALAAALALGAGAPAFARSGDDTFTTAATGLVRLGSSDPRWLAAHVSIDEGDELDDPGDGMAGFLVPESGEVLVVDDDGRETLLEPGDARFVAEGDELTLRAVDGDADLWRVGVTTSSAGSPFDGNEAVTGQTLVAHSGADDGADSEARRKVSLRIGALEDGDSATAGGDDETVPFLLAMDGDLVIGDDETDLEEGEVAEEPAADRDGSVDIEADGDALVGFVAVGPALDPDSLTEGDSDDNEEDEDDDDRPARATPTATTVSTGTGTGSTGGVDADSDGLTVDEEARLGTSDNDVDTDGDDAWDAEEAAKGTDPLNPDTDVDGFEDGVELPGNSDTDPLNPDTDGDGTMDGAEENCEVVPGEGAGKPHVECTDAPDPTEVDTDGDGLFDDEETNELDTDPTNRDTDGDTIDDFREVVVLGTDPTKLDTDDDQLWDSYEIDVTGTDPLDPDSDDDDLTDNWEHELGTDPHDQDTDDDQLWDGFERNNFTSNPLDADSDDDGLTDNWEHEKRTDPLNPDTDGDTFRDGDEVAFGTDPNDPNSKPTFELPDIDIPGL